MQTIAYYRIAKEDMDSTGYEAGLMGMNGREWYGGVRAFGFHTEYAAPSVVLFEKLLV